jgi:hypothetical protein
MSQPSFDISQIPPAVIQRLWFAFDVDGTLTRKDRTISPVTTEAVQAIFQAGGTAGVCTGRVHALLPKSILKQFADSAIHVVAGGALIVNQRGERLWGKELAGGLVTEIIQLALANGGGYGFDLHDELYMDISRQAQMREWFPEVTVKEWTPAFDLNSEKVAELVLTGMNDQIRAALQPYAEVITVKEMASREGKVNADITLKGVSKATGLRELARLKNIPLEEIIAVGDDHNDLEMLAESWGVAMGNAVPEAKAVAKLVIGHTDEDGLAEFISAVLEARTNAHSTS